MGLFENKPIGYAEFSRDGQYRYTAKYIWNKKLPRICFILLNPSTADAYKLDPTLKRCRAFAIKFGCGSMEIVNIFAVKATYPSDMLRHPKPIEGTPYFHKVKKRWVDSNALAILRAVRRAKYVVAGWGNDGAHLDRDIQVCRLLKGYRVWCLKPPNKPALTDVGQPRHPLYISGRSELHSFTPRGWDRPMRCERRVRLIEDEDNNGQRIRARLLQQAGAEAAADGQGEREPDRDAEQRVIEYNQEGRRDRAGRVDAERIERLRGRADRVGDELRGRSDGPATRRPVQPQASRDDRKDLEREDREDEVDTAPAFMKYWSGK